MGYSIVLASVVWNLFLALIPVALAYGLCRTTASYFSSHHPRVAGVMVGVIGLLWLAFLPNTCYLLTEWRHFFEILGQTDLHIRWTVDRERDAMVWLMIYTLFFLVYSLFGMLTFAVSIRPVARLVHRKWPRVWPHIGIAFFPLVSLGVYLGLAVRLNSWDLLSRPDMVWGAVTEAFVRPLLAIFILCFGGMLWLSYLVLDIWIDGLLLRVRQHSVSK